MEVASDSVTHGDHFGVMQLVVKIVGDDCNMNKLSRRQETSNKWNDEGWK